MKWEGPYLQGAKLRTDGSFYVTQEEKTSIGILRFIELNKKLLNVDEWQRTGLLRHLSDMPWTWYAIRILKTNERAIIWTPAMHVGVFPVCMYEHSAYACCLRRSDEDAKTPETGVTCGVTSVLGAKSGSSSGMFRALNYRVIAPEPTYFIF